jgi:DNA-binding NarL/FixJ family response regulator
MKNGGSSRIALIAAQPGPLRDGLQALLMTVPQIEAVCQVGNVSSVLTVVAEHHPTLVLLDTNFPGEGVLTVLSRIKTNGFQSRCLVLADEIQQQQDAKTAGADVALLKGFPAAKLCEIIEDLLSEPKVF